MAIMEFIQILVAIIIGLGMAEILKGFADLLRPGRSRVGVLHCAMAAWILLQLVQVWWAGWRFASMRTWQFHELLLYLLGITVLYMAARLIFPEDVATRDLRKYFDDVSGRMWALIATFFGLAAIINLWLVGTPLATIGPLTLFFMCGLSVFVVRFRWPWLQAVALTLGLAQQLWRTLLLGAQQ